MFKEFVEGVKEEVQIPGSISAVIQSMWDAEDESWKQTDLMLIGVPEGRWSGKNGGNRLGPDAVRREFYKLKVHINNLRIGDLGNIKAGFEPGDTGAALHFICEELLKEGVIPIVIGGGMPLTYSIYKAFAPVVKQMEATFVTPHLELEEDNFLRQICLHEPNYLFNVNVLAYQSYYVNPASLQTFEKMYFNGLRLGMLRSDIQESEPVIRNTHLFCIDIGAVKQADAPGNYHNNPNGLSSEEICQLCWYAGVSDTVRSFGLFEINPEFDYRNQTAKLGAQMLWYFVDGYANRKGDLPGLHQDFLKYRCTMNGNKEDVIFFKSKKTERWWMQLGESFSDNELKWVPCSYADYQMATRGDMPDRYWKALQKL